VASLHLGLGLADDRDRWVGEDRARDDRAVEFPPGFSERVLGDDPALPCADRRRRLGVVLATDDVARRPDVGLARAQLGIDRDAPVGIDGHSGASEPERVRVRLATGGDKEPLGADDPAGCRRLGMDPHLPCVAVDALNPGGGDDLDPFHLEDLAERSTEVGLVPREESRAGDDRHPATEPAEQLGELDRHVAAAEDGE
jgi:hypothetical protein